MIVTLTPNPSLDRTVEIDALVRGSVTRVRATRLEPAGKGVNVSRALVRHGVKTRAVLPVGGAEGAQLVALLGAGGSDVDAVVVPVAGSVRSNVSIVEPDGTTTKLNEPGPELSAAEAAALVAATLDAATTADWVVLSGSLPPGAPTDFYARVIFALRAVGVPVAVDSSGPALAAALAAGPELVKPNREELAEVFGGPVETLGMAVAAAEAVRDRGARAVLVSLGADGALRVDAAGALHGEAPARPVSTVGAGDALLAGYLAGHLWAGAGGMRASLLAEALAWGAAAVALPGSRMPGPDDLDLAAVRIHPHIDIERSLGTEPAADRS
jgi:1-phosphofructokinase